MIHCLYHMSIISLYAQNIFDVIAVHDNSLSAQIIVSWGRPTPLLWKVFEVLAFILNCFKIHAWCCNCLVNFWEWQMITQSDCVPFSNLKDDEWLKIDQLFFQFPFLISVVVTHAIWKNTNEHIHGTEREVMKGTTLITKLLTTSFL